MNIRRLMKISVFIVKNACECVPLKVIRRYKEKSTMKIAIVFDGLQIGGIERVGADYARILSELGHDVTVVNLVPNLKEMEKEFPKDCKWIGFNYPRRIVTEQYAQLVKKGFWGTACYLVAMLVMPVISYTLKRKFKMIYHDSEEFDLTIAFSGHFNDLDFVSREFIKSKKKMCWLHGALYSYFLISYGYMRLYEKIKNLIVLVDDAQEEALSYNKNLKLNIHKLYNPTFIKNREINCAHVEELKQKYGKFVLMVSRFEYPHKDQYTVAKMLDIVRKKYHEDLDLVFVGDGPDEESVKKYVITLSQDTQEHIHFEGSRFDVQDYYKAAFLLVHASVAGEGLPTIMIEAMSYRLPMVVTDSKTGPREILGENEYGLLCRVKDPEDMANKVKKIASDPDLYNHYVLKSDERIKDFSPDVIKERLKSILEEVEEN